MRVIHSLLIFSIVPILMDDVQTKGGHKLHTRTQILQPIKTNPAHRQSLDHARRVFRSGASSEDTDDDAGALENEATVSVLSLEE